MYVFHACFGLFLFMVLGFVLPNIGYFFRVVVVFVVVYWVGGEL